MSNQAATTVHRWRRVDVFCSIVAFAIFLNICFYAVSETFRNREVTMPETPQRHLVKFQQPSDKQWTFNGVEKEEKVETVEKTFYELGVEIQATKVTFHSYQCLYEEALAPYRHVKGLKILEIGLGCGMPSGPGVSYTLWTKYFLDPKITFMEYLIDCGEIWFNELRRNATKSGDISKLPTMFYGDMREEEDLRRMAEEHGPWDIIIDDGWHEPFCQIPALRSLLKHVNPGGTYFIEDLFMWGKKPENGTLIQISRLMALSIAQKYGKHMDQGLFQDLASDWDTPGIGERINRVSCCEAMCAIRLKDKF